MTPSRISRALTAAALFLEARIKGDEEYTWYKFGGRDTTISRRGKSVAFPRGTVFGVRPASSSKGAMRLVLRDLGLTIVFSPSSGEVASLLEDSVKAKSKAAPAPIDFG